MYEIRTVRTQSDAASVETLAWEFVTWVRERYPEMADEINAYMTAQRFEETMSDVLNNFCPPKGECLIVARGTEPLGILMFKDLGNQTCEMNRMFVREAGRGMGMGRALVARLQDRAREMGFRTMVLSALPRHHEALSLYRSVGFQDDDNPQTKGSNASSVSLKMAL